MDIRRDLRGLQTAHRHQHAQQNILPRQRLQEPLQAHRARILAEDVRRREKRGALRQVDHVHDQGSESGRTDGQDGIRPHGRDSRKF